MLERLQKILSARGIASRRKAEEYIVQGLVKVNGVTAKLGDKADTAFDTVEVDGAVLEDRAEMKYYVMNKPVGVETTNLPSPEGASGKTVRDILPTKLQGKVFPVGRLDKDSSGLLLFTNDGVLAFRLTHPKFDHQKEYEVTVGRALEPIALKKMSEGFEMDGSMTKPLICTKVAPNKARVILTEGKNRQVRRMFQNVGYTVESLVRVRIMTLEDGALKSGAIRALTAEEKNALLGSVGLQ